MKDQISTSVVRAGRRLLPALTICILPACVQGTTLWYNGDYDGNDAVTNQTNVPINLGGAYILEKSLTYDNFIVPIGQVWTVTSVFSNNQDGFYQQPTKATWEIRTGMSTGQGGVVVANGDTAATNTLKTAADGIDYFDPEYQVSAAVPSVVLPSGVYWLAVAPDSAGYYGDQSYNETTSGANAVGIPPGNDGLSFINNNNPAGAQTFAPSSDDYSAGIVGTATISVQPEPAGLSLLTIAASLTGLRRRRD